MKLTPDSGVARQMVILAPRDADNVAFKPVDVDARLHASLLNGLQRLRAQVYVDQGALRQSQLREGRHVQAADEHAWHIITVDTANHVSACARYVVYDNSVSFRDLAVSHSALATSKMWGRKLRLAVESELAGARQRGLAYVEVGGWAIEAALRCTTEAVRIMCSSYALLTRLGGALGVSTANRLCSAPLLRRIGGRPLTSNGVELPPYFEPEYNCELEALRFDSSRPNAKYGPWIDAISTSLAAVPVIAPSPLGKRRPQRPVQQPAEPDRMAAWA